MSDLHHVLDLITVIDDEGNISFKNYSEELWDKINYKIVFNNPERRDKFHQVSFGDTSWIMRNETRKLSFSSLTIEFQYEIKAIALTLLFIGRKRNYKKLKYSSIIAKVRYLKNFAFTLMENHVRSFNEINKLNAMKIQIIAKKFYGYYDTQIDVIGYITGLLENYNFITHKTYEILILSKPENENNDNNYTSYKSNSFPIIPDHVLLKTFYIIEDYKVKFLKKAELWSKYNTEEIKNIQKGIYKVENGEYISHREHDSLKCGNFMDFLNKFRKVVLFNTLLFTGMRKDEAKELKNTCLSEDEDTFYVTSSLGKTVENRLVLSWISSQFCNEMLNLLVKMNKKIKQRVQTVLDTNDPRFSKKYITHLKTNLENDKLFSFNYSLNKCRFDSFGYIKNRQMNRYHTIFKIPLDQHDINQLEFLDCNYITTSKASNNYMVKYKVGDYFNFTPHQFRHTFAYFMLSNNLCTIKEIKHQFKHLRGAMTYIYSRRGIYSELISQSKSLDETIKIKSLMGFSNSIAQQQSLGGGVKFILNALNLKDFKYNISVDPIAFNSLDQINNYLKNNKDSINFLPHGFCMNGSDCSLKSIAEPLSCINCHGYVTTNHNLPFWKGLLEDVTTKLEKIYQLPIDRREKFENLISNLDHKEKQLTEIINSLSGKKIQVNEIEVF